jgi:uncharacterized protein YcfL
MKIKHFIILAVAGIAMAGCNSNKNQENMEDSAIIDTVVRTDSVVVDTTAVMDTAGRDTM